MTKAKQGLIRGMGTNRRTEGDYMAALLDTVTLDDWRDVVAGALQLAKGGDAQARAWLAQYLVGKASASAPTALTVQVNQWSGKDPLAERLARPLIQREKFPVLAGSDAREAAIQDAITTELVRKLPSAETTAKPALARVCGEFGDETISNFPDDLGKYFELRKTGRDNWARTTRDNERSRA